MHRFATARALAAVRPAILASAVSVSMLAGLGCKEHEDIRAYDAPKADTAAAPQPALASSVVPAVADKPAADPNAPTWALPSGWKQVPGGSTMRFATISVSEKNPELVLTVIPLGPPQPLLENINRWEGEVGMTHSSAEQLKSLVRTQDFGGTPGQVVDLAGPGPTPGGPKLRTLAAMVDRGRQIWFFKLKGPDDQVAAQKENFDLFIKSVRFGAPQSRVPGTMDGLAALIAAPALSAVQAITQNANLTLPTLLADEGEKVTKYVAPKGWTEDKTPRMMRVMTFFVKDGEKQAEVSVLKLGAGNIGPLLANVNRWRAQVGAQPIAEINEKEIPKVTISGKEAYLFEFVGPNDKEPTKRMFITLGERGPDVYFFKIIGDAGLVAAQKDAFNQFLKSVEFGK
ncbi:hypothetical protein [Humisphaera borealis]|uniref:Uncharacterized protein n=1 Tax=Humisphaera borealis TaxID=2807512 RepID=A0A7M2WV49_9BACT|nr:hypothetical protein [Humisphaera borealis]QOV88711.1 hypothetical protein IPV69_21140 [Humisphaera borealis]